MHGAILIALSAAAFSGRDRQIHVEPPRIERAIAVDGVLDEPEWAQAARLTDFSQYAPVDGRPAENPTEILVYYSPTAIYFGVRAKAAPGSVRSTLANRDRIDADDAIQIFLNPFNDRRQALVFAVNPLGIQSDGALVENSNSRGGTAFAALESGRDVTDLTPDYVYESKGRLTADGYEIEIAIPFKSLRLPSARVQSWSLNVTRRIQSSGQEDTWVPALRAQSSFVAQSGTLDGLTGLRRGLVLDLSPVVTARADGARTASAWTYDASRPEVGANVRWGVTPNLTLNGTANPDFSQVEADASQFSYDPRNALFFPEKRPFFLEGSELFNTPNNLIYTRQIGAPVGAVKLTGKAAGTDIGVLSAVDDQAASASGRDRPAFTIARLQRGLRGASKVGLAYTDRTEPGRSNRVVAGDARLLFGSIYDFQLQAGASRTEDGASADWAPIWQATLNRNGRHFGYRYSVTGIHEDFRAASGFISRGGVITANLTHRGTWFGRVDAPVQSYSASVLLNGVWQYKDVTLGDPWLEKKLHFNNSFKFKGGWLLGASALVESFAFDQAFYRDYRLTRPGPDGPVLVPFTGTPNLHNVDYVLSAGTPQFSRVSASVLFVGGKDENFFEWSSANVLFATYALDWRPTTQLRVSPQYQLQSYDRRSDGSTVAVGRIPRLKAEYQVSRPVFVRFIGEYAGYRQDTLRDDSRTNLPIVIRDPATGLFEPSARFERRRLRVDALFSYQPTPGTVFFAGYANLLTAPPAPTAGRLGRRSDGFFVKASYLFRM